MTEIPHWDVRGRPPTGLVPHLDARGPLPAHLVPRIDMRPHPFRHEWRGDADELRLDAPGTEEE